MQALYHPEQLYKWFGGSSFLKDQLLHSKRRKKIEKLGKEETYEAWPTEMEMQTSLNNF